MERLVAHDEVHAVKLDGSESIHFGHRHRSEDGFLLIVTVALLLFFAVTVVALFGFTLTVIASTRQHAAAAADGRAGDAAMETVIGRVRADPDGLLGSGVTGSSCAGPSATYDVTLPPTSEPGSTATVIRVACVSRAAGGNRVIELTALKGGAGGVAVGRSLVRLIDTPTPGYRVTVCDWKVGQVSSGALAACP